MKSGSETEPGLVLELVERALELRAQGSEVDVDQLCRESPEVVAAVREVLAQQGEVDAWAVGAPVGGGLLGRALSNRYRLVERIGVGAMGEVYRGSDLELHREVAVKVLQPHLFGSPEAKSRFLREAEALAALRHPNVVAVYDRGVTVDGVHFLVMELLAGTPMSRLLAELHARVAAGGWESVRHSDWIQELGEDIEIPESSYVRTCARWTRDLAAGLSAAHGARIYHRDVKPSNVWIHRDGRALLLDFGIAARLDDADLTQGDTTLGTPSYMAPEQAVDRGRPGPLLDVYSLAATLYNLLGARPPYEGDAQQVLGALQRDDPRPVGQLHTALPRDLQAVVECGMARDPRRRYASAEALQGDLQAFLDHRPVAARLRTPLARAWGRARRSVRVRYTALAVVVAVLAVGIPAVSRSLRSAWAQEYLDLRAELPPFLTLEGRPVIRDPVYRDDLRQRLDRLVWLAPEGDDSARSLRAAFRFVHGDRAGAASDMAAIADAAGTPYTVALAERYRTAADESNDGDTTPNLSDLPDPATAADRYVAGFHALRARDYPLAEQLLAVEPGLGPSHELALLVRYATVMGRPAEGRLDDADRAALRDLVTDVLRLEGALGRKTTRTRHLIGGVWLVLKRAADAAEALEYVVGHAPHSYNALVLLGEAYRKTGRLELAADTHLRALQQRADSAKALSALAITRAAQRRFDEGLAVAAQMAAEDWRRSEAEGFVEFRRALVSLESGDVEPARAAAGRAAEHYRAVSELGHRTARTRMNYRACRAIADGENDQLVRQLFKLLAIELDAVHLANVVQHLPDDLTSAQTGALHQFLQALADAEREPR